MITGLQIDGEISDWLATRGEEHVPLTFVYRSPYDNLTGRHIKHFADETLLAWFQRVWDTPDPGGDVDVSELLFGQYVYGFSSLFDRIWEHQLEVPKSDDQLKQCLEQYIYAELFAECSSEVLQVFTDDDELDVRYFLMDDRFIERNQDRCAFLTHTRSLPTSVVGANGQPCTYLYIHAPEESADSQMWERVVTQGVRLDKPVATIEAYEKQGCCEACEVLAELSEMKSGNLTWQKALSSIAKKDRGYPARDGNQSVIDCSEHICQLHHHAKTWGETHLFHQIIVFDDLWAKAHPALSKSLDFYARDRGILENAN